MHRSGSAAPLDVPASPWHSPPPLQCLVALWQKYQQAANNVSLTDYRVSYKNEAVNEEGVDTIHVSTAHVLWGLMTLKVSPLGHFKCCKLLILPHKTKWIIAS